MSRRLPLERSSSTLGVAVYLGFLAAVFAGAGTCVYAVFQPVRLPNPGLAAYHQPAAYPPPQLYSAPVVLAEAQTDAPQAPPATAASTHRQAQSDAALEAHTPKKSKQAQSRSRDSTNPSTTYAQWPNAGQAFGQWSPRAAEAYGQWSPRRDSRQAQTQWPPRDSQARTRDPRNPFSAQTGPHDPRSQGFNQRSVSFAQSGFSRSW